MRRKNLRPTYKWYLTGARITHVLLRKSCFIVVMQISCVFIFLLALFERKEILMLGSLSLQERSESHLKSMLLAAFINDL